MSLVNEALKKARIEAAQRRTEELGRAPTIHGRPPVKLYSPEMRRPKPIYVIALTLAVFTAVFSGTVIKLTASSSNKFSPPPRRGEVDKTATVPAIQPRISIPIPPAPVVEPAGQQEPVAAVLPEPKPSAPPAAKVDSPASNPEPAPQTGTIPASPLVEGKVYLQAIDIAGAPKLKLDGILWSAKPLAVINGITAAPGDDLSDATVIAIEPKRVKLRVQGTEFFIRLP